MAIVEEGLVSGLGETGRLCVDGSFEAVGVGFEIEGSGEEVGVFGEPLGVAVAVPPISSIARMILRMCRLSPERAGPVAGARER